MAIKEALSAPTCQALQRTIEELRLGQRLIEQENRNGKGNASLEVRKGTFLSSLDMLGGGLDTSYAASYIHNRFCGFLDCGMV